METVAVRQLDGTVIDFAIGRKYRNLNTKKILGVLTQIQAHETEVCGLFISKNCEIWKDISWNFHCSYKQVKEST